MNAKAPNPAPNRRRDGSIDPEYKTPVPPPPPPPIHLRIGPLNPKNIPKAEVRPHDSMMSPSASETVGCWISLITVGALLVAFLVGMLMNRSKP